MKVALVKQVLDVCGPWSSIRWDETAPEKIFELWPGKGQFWELTCILKADWYVTPQRQATDYTRCAVLDHAGREAMILRNSCNVIEPGQIPFNDYDLIITVDAFLDVPSCSRPLFAYYASEHKDRHYVDSRRGPLRNYDLFLDHMMEASEDLISLPQSIAFPYLRDPDTSRSVFHRDREEAIGIDWRTVATLTLADFNDPWNEACESAARRLEDVLGLPLRYTGELFKGFYGVNDPPLWGHSRRYLNMISGCKYYLAAGRISGAGQGLADAASLGCICIGQKDKAYHRMLCHPECLSESLIGIPRIVKKIINSPDLHGTILAHQDRALRSGFVQGPIILLEKAIRWKTERAVAPRQTATDFQQSLAGKAPI
jgi:hypothetical protein